MSEISRLEQLDQFYFERSEGYILHVGHLLDDSLSATQAVPDTRAKFIRTIPLVQNLYHEGLEKMQKMQSLLVVDRDEVSDPMDVAASSDYTKRAVVECALHSIVASSVLEDEEKSSFIEDWVKRVSGPTNHAYRTRPQARLAAVDSLRQLHVDHRVPDAKTMADRLEAQSPVLRIVKLGRPIGALLIHRQK